ncbi:MAG: NAD(P)-binding protein, partial [Hadesarchaea archaeon]|nr:NAD(P)-binding protein [Hadesarchaea archaeon]
MLIIGAGPAGLFAAHELSKNSKLSVTVVDWGREIEKRTCPAVETGKCIGCKPCHIMCGLGGAGGMSSGILNLRYDIGGDLSKLTKSVP